MAADNLSQLESPELELRQEQEINDSFLEEHLYIVQDLGEFEPPWFVDFTNYLDGKVLSKGLSYQQKKQFSNMKDYLWEDPYFF